jgi:hypothetical protein
MIVDNLKRPAVVRRLPPLLPSTVVSANAQKAELANL